MSQGRKKVWILVASALLIGTLGAGKAIANSGSDSGQPITGSALERAKAKALEVTGGGKVTGTEVGDEEGYYEVEVTLPSKHQVDVHLDKNFELLDRTSDGGADENSSEGS